MNVMIVILSLIGCLVWHIINWYYEVKKEEEEYQRKIKQLFIPKQQDDVDGAKEQVIEKIKTKYNVELSKEDLTTVENQKVYDFLYENRYLKESENKLKEFENKFGDIVFVKDWGKTKETFVLKSKYKPRVDRINDFNFTPEQFLFLLETKQIQLAPITHYNEFVISVEPYFMFKTYYDVKTTPFDYVNINSNDLSSNGIDFGIKNCESETRKKVYEHMELRGGVIVDKKYLIYMIDKILNDETLKHKLNTNYIVHYLDTLPESIQQDINKLINDVGEKNGIDNLSNRFELINDMFLS